MFSLGYTPLEDAKTASNVKLIRLLEKFKNKLPDEGKENKPETRNPAQLQSTLSELSERVDFLESLLTEVSKIGDTLKTTGKDRNDDPETLRELGEKLAAMKAKVGSSRDN